MFELSVASKYLIPRRRQLSVSIISLISVLVISLVVWLIVVFFSVTDGLEKNWVQKLTALTAPVRITPTNAYYSSYYYQIDSISEASGYSHKTIREKQEAGKSNPYDPQYDQEIPQFWATGDLDSQGNLKDLVQLAYVSVNEIKDVPGIKAQDFELTASHINIGLQREIAVAHPANFQEGAVQTSLSYPSYLGNFVPDNSLLKQTLLPIETADINNYLRLIAIDNNDANPDEQLKEKKIFPPEILQERLHRFFDAVKVDQLRPKAMGWTIPYTLLKDNVDLEGLAIFKDTHLMRILIPSTVNHNDALLKTIAEQNLKAVPGKVSINTGSFLWLREGEIDPVKLPPSIPLIVVDQINIKADLDRRSLDTAKKLEDVFFDVEIPLQTKILTARVPYRGLEIASFQFNPGVEAPWVHQSNGLYILPEDPHVGEGILLPKSFKTAGVLIGDRGTLSYLSPTVSLLQEQYVPVFVAGFYDPGIIPIGGKFILANGNVTSLIRSSHQPDDKTALTNGINVRFDSIDQADKVKQQIIAAFDAKGISRYWDVQTYREYEFTKEIMHELQSQKNLFMLIAVVIILVACSNIISMLVILVNDKKVEIGILRAMGASSKSIALIFGLAGAAIGILGSVIGIAMAIFTLHHLDILVGLLSTLQGHEMFSRTFYGNALPSELSYEALFFVIMATLFMSLLAGIVPAVKACMVKPSTILRSAGG